MDRRDKPSEGDVKLAWRLRLEFVTPKDPSADDYARFCDFLGSDGVKTEFGFSREGELEWFFCHGEVPVSGPWRMVFVEYLFASAGRAPAPCLMALGRVVGGWILGSVLSFKPLYLAAVGYPNAWISSKLTGQPVCVSSARPAYADAKAFYGVDGPEREARIVNARGKESVMRAITVPMKTRPVASKQRNSAEYDELAPNWRDGFGVLYLVRLSVRDSFYGFAAGFAGALRRAFGKARKELSQSWLK